MNTAVTSPMTGPTQRDDSARVAPIVSRGRLMKRPSSAARHTMTSAFVSVIECKRASVEGTNSSPLACEHEILAAEREWRQQTLERAQRAQQMGKHEQVVRADDFEARIAQQPSRLERRDHDRVAIEGHAAHEVARARIP